ncbi:ribosome biogenesis GTP-binding protein YihA/YsxC [Niabella soli]|uniref:Probable GTP-binding protein EngB n=1 Tax=Niabella soli DSM 19437 TaxID=929713 RepID=W0ETF8_9BACT|nr:ribosome biogenesis GTP-binding protein YihA/YsxC [Niabella soli]AHF14052.1 GTP-binding protein YsxC [Niabella soli DSM 19437]
MEIISATYIKSSPDYGQCPKADRPEYAFIGRSNVGKSSLINMLCNKKALAKTSAAPGKTQLINHFEIISATRDKSGKQEKRPWYLVDLPGYGYAKVSQKQRKSWSAMIEKYILKRENLITLFVLIDSRHEPQLIDLEFINQLGAWSIPFALVFTKADKNKPGATIRNVDAFLNKLRETWEALPPHFITSAIDKNGREEVLEYVGKLNATAG